MINSFFFSYYSRIIQEYFQAKIGRKIRMFSLARKDNILISKKGVYCGIENFLKRYFGYLNLTRLLKTA